MDISDQSALWMATAGTLKSVLIGYPLGILFGVATAALLGYSALGRHVTRALGFAILALPTLLASYLVQTMIGPIGELSSLMAFIPSFALTLLITSGAAWKASSATPILTKLRPARRRGLLFKIYSPHIISGALTSAVISFPASLLYATIGDTASGSSDPSLGRVIVGSIPRGDIEILAGIAFTVFVFGLLIWLLLGLASTITDKVFCIESLDIESRSELTNSERRSLELAPLTGLVLVAAFFALGSIVLPKYLLIRSPITSLQSLGSDYLMLSEIAILVISTLVSALCAALASTVCGYFISTSLPALLKPIQAGFVLSAIFVQIVPITIIASLLWLLAPTLERRDWLVAVLSGLYPAYVVMRDRQRTMPADLLELLRLRRTGFFYQHYLVFAPWAAYALPTALLATVPFTVNALIVSGAVLQGDGTLGQLIYSVNARGEVTLIQGLSLIIISTVLLTTGVLTYLQRLVDNSKYV